MSERAHRPEKQERHATPEHQAEAPQNHEREKRHESHEHEKRPDTHQLERQIKQEAKSRHETPVEAEQTQPEPVFGAQKDIKAQAYQQTLRKVRSRLSPSERTLSKIIHQPLVESISEASSKTIARPSGLLGGGIAALIGTGTLLYMSKHYGFRYSFFVYILLFVVGFGLGLVIEFLVKASRSNHS